MKPDDLLLFSALATVLMPFILAIGVLVLIMTCGWAKQLRQFNVDLLLRIFNVRRLTRSGMFPP